MDEVTLIAKLDADTTIYVSAIHENTYHEFFENDTLGGSKGYFVAVERQREFEVLAKAASLDAARTIFSLITSRTPITA